MAQPTVHTRLTMLPRSMPMRHVRSSRPVPTAASWCGCAMMPTRPLTVSIAIAQGPTPDGVASEKRNGSSDACMPGSPPTKPQPSGMSMKDSAMMSTPWNRSVQAAATRPPTKL